MAYTLPRRPSSYAGLVSESRALLHEAKAEAIRERESVSALEAKRRELESALDRSAEQRTATRLARQAARDMAYRAEAAKQSAQQRRAEIRQKHLEDYQRELREIHEERRRREASSERWWTDKLLGILADQVDNSCNDMVRVRLEISRTRAMLTKEARNAKIKAALAPCTNSRSATHIHHHHYPPKPPASVIPKPATPPFAKYHSPEPAHTPLRVYNHTHIHVDRSNSEKSLLGRRHAPKTAHTHVHTAYRDRGRGATVAGPFSSPGESDNESDVPSAIGDIDSSDEDDDDDDEEEEEEAEDLTVRAANASAARMRPSVKDMLAKDRAARFSVLKDSNPDERRESSETASQLEETLAERHDVSHREREKLVKVDEENERKNRSHCSHLVRAIQHANTEIKVIRSDQHRVLAKERARSRKLERQLKRLEVSYKRIQAARPRHSWVPSGYGTT